MSSREDVIEVMGGLGPLDEDIASVVETPEGTWVVGYEDCDVEVDYDEATRTLSFATPLGFAKADRLAGVCATLLKYNAIRRDTGGVVMAMMPDDRLVQTLDLVETRVTGDGCVQVLRNFVTKARIWRGYIAGEGEAPAAEERVEDLMSFAIRI